MVITGPAVNRLTYATWVVVGISLLIALIDTGLCAGMTAGAM